MIASAKVMSFRQRLEALQDQFLQMLPRIESHARFHFRGLACPHARAERIAECTALAWKSFLRLADRGRDARQFPAAFATLVARAVKCGRRLASQERSNNVLNAVAQRRRGFVVECLPNSTRQSHDELYSLVRGQQEIDAYEERLHNNCITPPPDAAAFRVDFPLFLRRLTQRDRDLAMFLSLGHAGKLAAARFRLTPGRVTQLRQQWRREWHIYQGDFEAVRQGEPNTTAPVPSPLPAKVAV
jgi:hypothetical protein